MEQPNEPVSVSVIWPDVDKLPVYAANQFSLTAMPGPGDSPSPEGVLLTVGHVSPPLIAANNASEYATMLKALNAVPVQALGRYSLSLARARELSALLSNALAQFGDHPKGENS